MEYMVILVILMVISIPLVIVLNKLMNKVGTEDERATWQRAGASDQAMNLGRFPPENKKHAKWYEEGWKIAERKQVK